MVWQLEPLGKVKGEVEVMKEHAAAVRETKSVEVVDLRKEKESMKSLISKIAEELENRRIEVYYCIGTIVLFQLWFGITQAETFREDFERERKDREKAASRYEEEKAEMNLQHQTIVDGLEKQLKEEIAKLCVDHQEVVNDLLKQVEEAEEKGNQILEEQAKRMEDIQCLKHEKEQLVDNRDHLKQDLEHARKELEHTRKELEHLREELGKKDEDLQLLQVEKDSLEEARSKLDDRFKEKEAILEKTAAHKADLEKQLTTSEFQIGQLKQELEQVCLQRDQLHVDMHQKLENALADTARLNDDNQAKTQQVKQYKKQVDNFRAQVQQSNARIEELQAKLEQYQNDLAYCQRDLQTREEEEQSKVPAHNTQ